MNRKRKRKAAEATALPGEATPSKQAWNRKREPIGSTDGDSEETAEETQTLVLTFFCQIRHDAMQGERKKELGKANLSFQRE